MKIYYSFANRFSFPQLFALFAVFAIFAVFTGNHFDEWCGIGDTIDFTLFPSPEEQKQFIEFYLEAFNALKSLPPPSEEDVNAFYQNVGKMCLLSHFYWGVWALLQSKISQIDFDYLAYGKDKLTEYFTRKEEFLNL